MKFTEDDDSLLVQFIAESHSEFKGRKGELLYKKLVQQHADSRHSWKSWQHYYVKHADYFDHLIEQYQLEHSISIPPTVTNQIQKRYGFTEAEDALLVEHIAKNDLSGQRKGLSLYNVLSQRDGKQHERSSKSWCHRYSKNADYFDRLVDIYRREHNVNKHLISTLGTPVDSSSETSVGISSPSTSRSRPSASLPLLSAPKSTRFKREEDMNLVAYLSENTSSSPRIGLDERNSFKLYSNLTQSNARSWAASRSANSWFIRYTSNVAYFETLIEQYRSRNSTTPCVTLGKRKRDPRVLPSSSTSASSLFEDNSFIGKEDNRQRISYRPRKRLCGSGSSRALDGDAGGDAVDRAGNEYNRDEDHNKAYRRSKRLPAAPSSRSHGSDNSGEESDNEEDSSTPIEETGSLGRAGFSQREGAHTLSSLTMRFTRRHLRNSRAQDNVQDEDDDLIEVDSYLRGCSVGSVESNLQSATDPPNSHSDKSSGARVRFASPCVSAKYTSTTIATLSPSLTEPQEFSATPIYVWRRVKILPRIQTLTSTDRPDTRALNSPYDSDDCVSASADANNGLASVMPAHSSRRLRSNSLVRTRNVTKDSATDPRHPKTKCRVSTRLQTPSPSTYQSCRTRSMTSSAMKLGGRGH